jgi:transposase
VSAKVSGWMLGSATATGSGIPDLRHFAAGLGTDKDAVQAGLTLLWSNGQTEAQIGATYR